MLSDIEIKNKLKSFGRLEKDFSDLDLLIENISNKNEEIRFLAITNLAKLGDVKFLNTYKKLIQSEPSSRVRREIASAIGRIRSTKCIPLLFELLKDKDPNIILQSIRGLLVFKDDKEVITKVKRLKRHKNEIIRKVIRTEFPDQGNSDKKNTVEFPEKLKNCIIKGDALKILRKVEDESIHLTFTSYFMFPRFQ